MSGYELQQFVMVSSEVWQDLHLRYAQSLWPWWLVLFLLNGLVLLKNQRALFFGYVGACWIFLGAYYFMHYVDQVHTFAFAMGVVFILQGLALFYLKVLRSTPEGTQGRVRLRGFALFIYGATALVPLSYVLENSRESIMLFGWGPEQTALGTVGLVLFSLRSKIELILVFIPLVWICFYLLAL